MHLLSSQNYMSKTVLVISLTCKVTFYASVASPQSHGKAGLFDFSLHRLFWVSNGICRGKVKGNDKGKEVRAEKPGKEKNRTDQRGKKATRISVGVGC